jgi:hypothetical protein
MYDYRDFKNGCFGVMSGIKIYALNELLFCTFVVGIEALYFFF